MTSGLGKSGWPLIAGLLHYLFGIGGQVAAAAPVILVTMILSHTAGLVTAANFVAAAAASAIIFTFAYLGFVYYVTIDRLCEFDVRDYVLTRLGATGIAALVLFACAPWMGVSAQLCLLVALLRGADAAVDLTLGLDLLREPTATAMRRYATLNLAKLLLVLLPVGPMFVLRSINPVDSLILSATVAAVFCWFWLFRLSGGARARSPASEQVVRSLRLARRAVWFAVGVSICAAAVSAPRLLMPHLYRGDELGVVGVSLAFSTCFSMAFMASWLRWFPRLCEVPESKRRFTGFFVESLAMALLFVVITITVAPLVVAFLFGFDVRAYGALCEQILLASIVAAFAMNMANLFKLTRAVWLESLTYVAGIIGGLCFVLVLPSKGVPGFLIFSAMATVLAVAAGLISVRPGRPAMQDASDRKRAVFLRMAARPVPRVVRMMQVARHAGFEATFVGAFREPGLAVRDDWDGFLVRRVGRVFPLLNGKNAWLYLRCVLAYNHGFWAILREQRPSVIHASDFEAMPASILYRLCHRCRLVYNIHDNLGQRYALPSAINACLNSLEGVAVLLSDQALVPEVFRRSGLPSWCHYKVGVIRNLPPDTGSTPPQPFKDGKFRIFYGGWLDWQRGLSALLSLANEPDIELRIAGEGAPDIVAALKASGSINYLGFLDSQQIIEETKRCHFVPVLYDPARVINRFAASNKLAEALSIGRPAILNEELEIAKELIGGASIIRVPYSEAGDVASQLRLLVQDRAKYAEACADARLIYEAHYDWEKAKLESLTALTGEPASLAAVHGPAK